MPKKTVHVVPNPDGGWDVKSGGATKAHRHYDRKTEAIDKGREVSRNNDGELFIHGRDGKIQEKDSHGNDDFPPPG